MTAKWHTVAMPTNEASAQVLIGLLQSEGIPARLNANVPVPGLALSCKVEVPEEALRRAEAVLRDNSVTEEELTRLALGTEDPPASS